LKRIRSVEVEGIGSVNEDEKKKFEKRSLQKIGRSSLLFEA